MMSDQQLTCEKVEYAVLTATLGGWEDAWSVTDKNGHYPDRYPTKAAAQAEIDDTINEVNQQIEDGEREPDEAYSHEDYRIVEVVNGKIAEQIG